MSSPSQRFDNIPGPALTQIARQWMAIVPDDMPPAVTGEGGNTGTGCVGIFVAQDGYVRMIFRGQQFSLVGGDHHDVQWPIGHQVGLMLAGVSHRVQWLPSVADSVRVWAEAGTYLWGQCVHVMAHDSTVPLGSLFALRA